MTIWQVLRTIHEVFNLCLFVKDDTGDFYKVNQKPASVDSINVGVLATSVGFPQWRLAFLIAILLFCIVVVVWLMIVI